jgi:hypothetical protein
LLQLGLGRYLSHVTPSMKSHLKLVVPSRFI